MQGARKQEFLLERDFDVCPCVKKLGKQSFVARPPSPCPSSFPSSSPAPPLLRCLFLLQSLAVRGVVQSGSPTFLHAFGERQSSLRTKLSLPSFTLLILIHLGPPLSFLPHIIFHPIFLLFLFSSSCVRSFIHILFFFNLFLLFSC